MGNKEDKWKGRKWSTGGCEKYIFSLEKFVIIA